MKAKNYAAYGMVLALVASLIVATPAKIYAQEGLVVNTDKAKYMTGETVRVTGQVPEILAGFPITIQVINENGARFNLDQIFPDEDGNFSWEFKLTGSEARLGPSGTWTVKVAYGDLQAETTFEFEAVAAPAGLVVEIDGEQYTIDAELTNGRITNVIAEPRIATLTLEVSMNDDGKLTATLPRTFLDSLTEGCSGDDDVFVVLLDDQTEFPEESKADGTRTITIDVPVGTTEIAIVGTCMVPEFGVIAALVLAASVGAIIVATRRNIINLRY
jgi:predicted secreted protein with PEFG-CTERM motif